MDAAHDHCLFMSNKWRNPAFHGGSTGAVMNCLIYNPGAQGLHIYKELAHGPTKIAAVKNLTISGPSSQNYQRMANAGDMTANPGAQIYLEGNLVDGIISTWNVSEVAGLALVSTPPLDLPVLDMAYARS